MKKNRNQSTDAAELRRYAEETLSASEIWYRRLFETAQDGILILDAETGMVVDMNPFLIEMLGYSHEAFLGKKVWELGFFKDIVANQDNFAELQQKGYIRYGDMPLETSDGRQIEVEFVSNLYLVNHQKVIQCNIRDITGRKQAEEKIRRLATVVRDSSDAITIQDFEGRITAWNRGAELMYGYSEAEALLANIERLTAPGKVEEQKEFTRRLMAGEAITAFETQRLTKDGRVLDVWLTVTKLMDAAGKPMGIASTERDITALKRAEEKLRETNDYLENLINHANAPIIVWDPQFRITRFNGAFESLTGRRADEVIGKPIEILFPPALAESSMELIAKTQTGERWETVEIHIQHIDGTRRTVLWNSATLFAPDGKTAVATIAQGMDITERNQVAEKMRRMATVVRDSNDAITISDFSGQITAWNHGAEQMYGYSEAEALQMSIWRITPAAKIAEKKAFIARLMAGEAITAFETQRLTKDGRVLDVWLTVTKLTDDAGKPVGIASTERDITARKRAHAALEQSERNFHNILQGSPDGMVIVDSNGLIIFANAAAADVFGRPREQLLGTSFDQPIILGQNTELAGVNPAKKNMVVEMRMIQTLWQENPACLVSLRDITHRKHNEQQLRLAGTELRRVNQNLVTRNAEIQNFYHTLSHELKTPLTSAREFVSIVMDGLAGPLTETQLEYLGIAKESCDQLRLYINDLLDVTRLETGKMSIEFQRCRWRRWLNEWWKCWPRRRREKASA
jgi:PAS domain S-box-containing protein